MNRYDWITVGTAPQIHILVDCFLAEPIGTVVRYGQQWHWERDAGPAVGVSDSLEKAKAEAIEGCNVKECVSFM